MKKRIAMVLGLVLVVAAIFGPDLLDLVRLDQYIQASAKAYEAERGPWPQLSDACVGCHGEHGHSDNQHYPSLAGQSSAYLAAQLRSFASGERAGPIMAAMARSLRDDDIKGLSAYFARQHASDNRYFTPDSRLLEQGRQIAGSGVCAACHGEGLMGKEAFPRLAGLGYDYLLGQLDAYADGTRRDPAHTMNTLAAAWSPDDRKAIATFLASHPVAGGTKP